MGVHNFKRALNNVIIIINKNKQKPEEEEYVKQHCKRRQIGWTTIFTLSSLVEVFNFLETHTHKVVYYTHTRLISNTHIHMHMYFTYLKKSKKS